MQKVLLATGSVAFHAALLASVLAPGGSIQAPAADQSMLEVRLLMAPARVPDSLVGGYFRPDTVALVAPQSLLLPYTHDVRPVQPERDDFYLPSTLLDRRPTPVSEPDIKALQDVTTSGLAVRLRIYIDRFGKVDDVVTVEASDSDQDFAAALRSMFRATAFLPGRRDGIDVPSYLDIVLSGH